MIVSLGLMTQVVQAEVVTVPLFSPLPAAENRPGFPFGRERSPASQAGLDSSAAAPLGVGVYQSEMTALWSQLDDGRRACANPGRPESGSCHGTCYARFVGPQSCRDCTGAQSPSSQCKLNIFTSIKHFFPKVYTQKAVSMTAFIQRNGERQVDMFGFGKSSKIMKPSLIRMFWQPLKKGCAVRGP